MKKVAKSVPAPAAAHMPWFLIAALVILLAFAIYYVYKIQKQAETYVDGTYQVIYIYSSTCPYCIKFSPVFSQWSASQATNQAVTATSLDRSDPLAAQYIKQFDVTAYPTVLVLKPCGSLAQKSVGAQDIDQFSRFVNTAIGM
jgi:thiol-disulfide isomerase/thioredoxin